MEAKPRKRGAPRRGPITDKTASIATKVRPDTLAQVQAFAQSNGMSNSQALEVLIVRALEPEEAFGAQFAPCWRTFANAMRAALTQFAASGDIQSCMQAGTKCIDRHANDLREGLITVCGSVDKASVPVKAQRLSSTPTGFRRGKRSLEVD